VTKCELDHGTMRIERSTGVGGSEKCQKVLNCVIKCDRFWIMSHNQGGVGLDKVEKISEP
jgi:hypothetical protein